MHRPARPYRVPVTFPPKVEAYTRSAEETSLHAICSPVVSVGSLPVHALSRLTRWAFGGTCGGTSPGSRGGGRSRDAATHRSTNRHPSSPAVENTRAKFLQPQDRIIWTPFGLLCHARVDHFTNDNGMVAFLDGFDHPAFHEGWLAVKMGAPVVPTR